MSPSTPTRQQDSDHTCKFNHDVAYLFGFKIGLQLVLPLVVLAWQGYRPADLLAGLRYGPRLWLTLVMLCTSGAAHRPAHGIGPSMASKERGIVTAEDAGTRLDLWLSTHTTAGSRSKAKKALRTGKVTIDGRPVGPGDAGRPVQQGNIVVIAWSRPGTSVPNAVARERLEQAGVDIVHIDDELLVANKPTGLLTDTATRAQFRDRDSLRKQLRARLGADVFPAHRIDRDTTGVVAFGRTPQARDDLRAQWLTNPPDRVYLVVVEGLVDGDSGRWSDWMLWDPKARKQELVRRGTPEAVLAEADWQVIARGKHLTRLEVRLITGRRNQIRLQAMLRGHPLVGETQYRAKPATRRHRLPRQALHAHKLSIDHPVTGKRMTFEAPIPDDLARLIARL